MSSPHKTPRGLDDFAEILRRLDDEGFEFAVIGGCAVGAYARLRGETVFSADLDLYTTSDTLYDILRWAPRHNVRVVKRPRPRALQVAVLDWTGRELNLLSETTALPAPEVVVRSARELMLLGSDIEVPIADPYDLLANKLAVDRPKDRAHAEVLRRFIEEEIVAVFGEARSTRQRIAVARRYLEVMGADTLQEPLAARLVPLADHPAIRRFLVHRVPSNNLARSIIATAHDSEEQEALKALLRTRGG